MALVPLLAIPAQPGLTGGPRLAALLLSVAGLTAFRPGWGLLTIAGLFPMAPPLAILLGDTALPEQMLLTFIGVAGLRLSLGGAARPIGAANLFLRALLLFGVVLACGQLVQLSFSQQRTSDLGPFVAGFGHFVMHGYFGEPGAFYAFPDLLTWLEPLAVAAIAAYLIDRQPELGPAVGRMLVVSGGAFATFSAVRLLEIALRNEAPLKSMVAVIVHLRFNAFYQDINAAGSLFALFFVPAAWFAWRTHRVWAAAVVGVLALAVWLAGSRAAFLGGFAGLGLAWLVASRPSRKSVIAVTVVAVAGLVALATLSPRNLAAGRAALLRVEMSRVALRLTATAPVFGVGLNTFKGRSVAQYSDQMQRRSLWRDGENAHNNFLQILAELGLVGLLAFLSTLVPVFGSVWRQVRAGVCRPETLGLAGGLIAFLASALLGHPLLTQHVRAVFFLLLGVTAGLSGAGGLASASRRWPIWWVTGAIGVLILALPFRVFAQRGASDLTGYIYGASDPREPIDDVVFRNAAQASTWFISTRARALEIPLRVTADSPMPCAVDLIVDGRIANQVAPPADRWTRIEFQFAPPSANAHARRIDMHVANADCHLLVGALIER